MKYFKKIEGDRLYLSPINVQDIEIYTKWMNDKEVTENIGVFTKVKSMFSEEEWIKKNSEKYAFAIVLKENDELIGNIALKHVDGINGTATLGVFIGEKENRNKGYGKESIKLLLNYGFNSLNLKNVMLKVYSFNKRAINTYKKIGFKKIGSRRGAYYKDGKRYDIVYMDILKSEFNDIKDFIFTV